MVNHPANRHLLDLRVTVSELRGEALTDLNVQCTECFNILTSPVGVVHYRRSARLIVRNPLFVHKHFHISNLHIYIHCFDNQHIAFCLFLNSGVGIMDFGRRTQTSFPVQCWYAYYEGHRKQWSRSLNIRNSEAGWSLMGCVSSC